MALDPSIILHAGDFTKIDPGQLLETRAQLQMRNAAAAKAAREEVQAQARVVRLGQLGSQAAAGDYTGATTAAAASGDPDTVSYVQHLSDEHRAAVGRRAAAAAPVAYAALQEPDPTKRQQIIAAATPSLVANGWTPEEIAGFQPTNEALTSIVASAQTLQSQIDQHEKGLDRSERVATLGETVRHNRATEALTGQQQEIEASRPVSAPFGASLINPRTGRVVFGGDSGGTAGGSRVMGWSPAGDNSRASMDTKNNLISRAAGVSPDQPLSRQQFIALNMTLGEGGAAAPNNPGNMRNTSGQFQRFPNAQAYQSAQAAWLGRRFDEGARTVRDAVEGRAVAGGNAGGLSPEAIDLAARQGIANGGTVPPGYSRNRAAQAAITNRMAQLAGGQSAGSLIQQGQDTKSQGAAVRTWNSGRTGTGAAQVRSLGVAVDHLDQLSQAARALGNGNTPMFNSIAQSYARATGSAVPTNFDSIKQFVTDEVTKAIIGGGGGVADREHAASLVASANSPAQLSGAIRQLQGLMAGQLHGLSQQYQQTTGRNDFERYVSPRSRAVLERQTGTLSPSGGAIPTLTPDQARAAPKGTRFRTSDGRVMVRQ